MITNQDITKLKTVFATKDDLKGFATKDDLKGFATKDDLKGFATKDDLHLSYSNLKAELFEEFDDKLDQKFTQFKSEIFDKLDNVIGELKSSREEQTLVSHQTASHSDQLEDHEKRLTALESPPALVTA